MEACDRFVKAVDEQGMWNEEEVAMTALYELIKHVKGMDERLQHVEDMIGIDRTNLQEVDQSLRQVYQALDERVTQAERRLDVSDSPHKVPTLRD